MNAHIEYSPHHCQLPKAPDDHSFRSEDMDIYMRFMRHLRNVPAGDVSVKIVSSIQFTADFLVSSDAHVAKVLVDLGLRAPRQAFPASFLDYADGALSQGGWSFGGANKHIKQLHSYWVRIGDVPMRSSLTTEKKHDEEAMV